MFIGNTYEYDKLVSWINKPQESGEKLHYKNVCIVTGSSGIGKTFGINIALKASNKHIYKLNDLDCSNSKEFRDLLNKITSSHVMSQFENLRIEDKIIWIDDFDSFIIFDRTFLHTLQNILDNESFPAIKIIISTSCADLKHYTKFYSHGLIISLKIPEVAAVIPFLRKTYPNVSVKAITNIADSTNGNISSALHMIDLELQNIVKKTKLIQIIPLSTKTIDTYYDLVDLFNTNYNIEIGRYIFHIDPWLHPLRFHENILQEWPKRKGTVKNKEATYTSILQLYCDWDQIMSYSKINDSNDIYIATELIAHVPSYLKTFGKKKSVVSTMDEFTRMFNFLSLKKKNSVALYTTDFPWITIGSFCKHLYDDKNKKKPKTKKFSM